MRQKCFAFLLVLGFFAALAAAQEQKPLIKLNPFSIEGIGSEESRLIASLVQSYLSDIGRVIGYAAHEPANPPEAQMEHRGAVDYTINGTIRLEQDGPVFMLEITNTKTGEHYTFNSSYRSTVELTLKARSVLESAFAPGGFEAEKKTASRPEHLNENLVVGTWKGEAGIELVRLLQGGRGIAVFSSGAQMVLAYRIEGNTLKIWQISPNTERFYFHYPQPVARRLARDAEPMNWELSLYEAGTILGGVKQGTGVRLLNDEVTELLPGGDLREVVWNKSDY